MPSSFPSRVSKTVTGMRIISGKFKGRRLHGIPGNSIRPTSDRVREALFNILGRKCRQAVVLDLFAGTGALGLEAVSRGAKEVVFVDKSSRALDLIRKNIALCGVAGQACVLKWDISRSLACLGRCGRLFDLVFIDPPYATDLAAKTLYHLEAQPVLGCGSQIVIEHARDNPPDSLSQSFQLVSRRTYGGTGLSFVRYTGRAG